MKSTCATLVLAFALAAPPSLAGIYTTDPNMPDEQLESMMRAMDDRNYPVGLLNLSVEKWSGATRTRLLTAKNDSLSDTYSLELYELFECEGILPALCQSAVPHAIVRPQKSLSIAQIVPVFHAPVVKFKFRWRAKNLRTNAITSGHGEAAYAVPEEGL